MSQHELYDLAGVAKADRPERWEEMLHTTVAPIHARVDQRDRVSYRASIERRWFDDIALLDIACDPSSGERTRQLINMAASDSVAVFFAVAGVERLSINDEKVLVTPGSCVTWDTTQRINYEVVEHFRKTTLIMPRVALEEVRGRSWPGGELVLDVEAPSVRLLRSFLDSLASMPDGLPAATVTAARNAALELVAAAIRPEVSAASGAIGEALRVAVERWVARNIGDRDVSVGVAARANGVSIRTLQRCFASAGTSYGAMVRAQRLGRARRDLIEGQHSLQAIANRWGFADSSHFYRAFKSHFGVAPSEYRELSALTLPPRAAVQDITGNTRRSGERSSVPEPL